MAKNLSQLRDEVRQKADIENDGISLLQSLLVDGTDGQLFAKNAPNLVQLGDYSYQLPTDFSQLVSVDIRYQGHYIRSFAADPQDYAHLTDLTETGYASISRHFLRWNMSLGRPELFVFPARSVSDIAVQYIPAAPTLSLDSDVLGWPDFWNQWVVLDAAIQCLNKEESITSALSMEKEKVERRIRDHIRSMSTTEIQTIRKVSW